MIPIRNVLEYLERSARRYPDRTACADEQRAYRFCELERLCRSIGSALSYKVEPREPVAVYLEKSGLALAAALGAVYAGGFYVSLNPELPAARLRQIQSVLGARFVVTDRAHQAALEGVFPREAVLLAEELAAAPAEEERLAVIRSGMIDADPLYANFTSGSTGIPKGVVVSHRSVLDFIDVFTERFGLTEEDRIGNQAPFDFDVSVKDIYSCLKTGAALVILPRRIFSRPKELLDELCGRQVTVLIWAVSALCLVSTFHGLAYRTPDTVRLVMFSGEVMPEKHLREWMTRLPHARFVNLYGPTEITCNCTYHELDRRRDYAGGIPIGRPFPNEEVFLLDGEDREICRPDITGEICVRGAALALGYYRAPDQTAAVFSADPRNTAYAERIYRTGDLGRYSAEGELYYQGRKDFQIKHLGHRIELEEIERAISALPQVERCCCVYDEERQRICGFYIGEIEKTALRRELREKLPPFMVPGILRQMREFPLTKNGKTDRKKLLEGGEGHDGAGNSGRAGALGDPALSL